MTPETLPIDQYEQQLAEKAARLRQMMLSFQAPDAQLFRSQPAHYRMRAEFRIWHDEDDLYHIMFDPQTKARIRIDHFMPGSPLINALMTEMMTAIRPEPLLRAKLFQIDYLTTQSGEAVVTPSYITGRWTTPGANAPQACVTPCAPAATTSSSSAAPARPKSAWITIMSTSV